MARTVRNPLELRTPVRTISSVMRNAPRQKFRPTELDFGDGFSRPERGGRGDLGGRGSQDDFGNLTSVSRAPRETIAGRAPVSEGVATPTSRGTTAGAPAARVQTGTSRAPQASPKPLVTSTIKAPAAKPVAAKPVAAKPATTKPAATKTTTALKPAVTKTPVTAKTTTPKVPVAAKTTTKTPIAAKTTPTKLTTPTTPVKPTGLPITKPVTKPTSPLTSTLTKAAVGAGTAALINNLVNKKTTPTTSVVNKPAGLVTNVAKPNNVSSAGNVASTASKVIPKTGATASTTAKAATAGTTTALTDEQIQAELDRARDEGATGLPEGAVTNEDGTYSVTADGMTTTYAADGSIIGMEATTDTTGTDTTATGSDATTGMTDLGEGYFADADGNIYGSDGSLMYTVGANGEYVDANVSGTTTPAEETTYTDPDTGLTWNKGADGTWTQEGFEDAGGDTTVVNDAIVDDGTNDDELGYLTTADDGTNYEEDAKGGSIHRKHHFVTGGPTALGYGDDEGYSDTGEEVQPFQNLENSGVADVQNSDLNDNGDGTYSYFDGKEYVTIDDTGYELYRTNEQGQVVETEAAPMARNNAVTTEGDDNGNTTITDANGNRTVYDPNGDVIPMGGGREKPYANQSGILDSLLSAVKENPSLAGGAVGALIASLMDQAGGDSSTRQPVDMSELYSMAPRTTDFGAGMVGGRTGTGSPLVSYADYAGDNGDEIIDDRLFSDLGVSGYLREPDMADYRDEDGNLTDQSGNLVDEYGYLLDDGNYEEEVPEEENAVEDAGEEEPTMASGGTTHYTFGRVMNPADNLGLSQGMKQGGLSQAHTVHSHQTNSVVNNRVDFRKGSAVNGAGDGQSDDIPAWLADGEYVMDAELVSMLGNGSNKAGAKILDKFREDVRAHKRSAPLGKIPPKAKSPLNYLKESMNG